MSLTPTARYFRTLAGHTLVFGLSTLVRPLSQLLLVRLHTNTHFVSVQDFAAWNLLQIALNIGIVIINMGLATAFFRHYLLASSDMERRQVVGRGFRLSLVLAVAGGGLLLLLSESWSTALIGNRGYGAPARDIALAVFGNTLSIIPLALLRAEGRWKPFVIFNILRFLSLIGLNGWFLIPGGMGLRGITLALALTNIAIAVLFLPVLRGKMDREPFLTGWKVLLRYGAPLIAIDVTLYVLNGIPRILLNLLRGPADVALFGFALNIAFIAQVAIVMPFNIAFGPHLFRAQRDQGDPRPLFARTMGYIWTIAAAVALGVSLFSPELAWLLGKNPLYHTATPQVLWLAFAVTFYGIFVVFSSGASLKDKTWIFPVCLLGAALIETALAHFWIRSYGLAGAAWATFAGYTALAAFTLLANQVIYPITFPWSRVIRVGLVAVAIMLTGYVFPGSTDSIFARLGLFAAFPCLLLLTGYLDSGERAAVRRWLRLSGDIQ